MIIQTGRNPFARHTIRKRKVPVDVYTCLWCGGVRQNKRGRYLWKYYYDADSLRESGSIKGLFCNIGCLNSYHAR